MVNCSIPSNPFDASFSVRGVKPERKRQNDERSVVWNGVVWNGVVWCETPFQSNWIILHPSIEIGSSLEKGRATYQKYRRKRQPQEMSQFQAALLERCWCLPDVVKLISAHKTRIV